MFKEYKGGKGNKEYRVTLENKGALVFREGMVTLETKVILVAMVIKVIRGYKE